MIILHVQQVVFELYQVADSPNNIPSEEYAIGDHRTVWLLYEVLIFYFNIFSTMLFLFVSRFHNGFTSMRDKVGLGANLRYRVDYLSYCKEDLHWFTIFMNQLFLGVYAYKKRIRLLHRKLFTLSLTTGRNTFCLFIVTIIFFTDRKISMSWKTICLTIATICINLIIWYIFSIQEYEKMYWSLFILYDSIL